MFVRIMSSVAVLAGLLVAGPGTDSKPLPQTKLQTVEKVDLSRYTGKWYEIARYPNRFQRDCASDTTATYSLRKDGKISVINSCLTKERKNKTARGTARVADKQTNAKLRVTFFWPFSGDYWIIALDPGYKYAVVGEPKRKYLWILSRTPVLDDNTYLKILDEIRNAGYDPSKLLKTPQSVSSS
ncbi:MAG TPA: lipocalin family protein [Candidatus Binatia bacterium]|nr:lipocalin family protein [Candidatus Binatia bacterium]